MSLVVSVEVHPPNERCFISGESQGVCPGGHARMQQVIVVPHAIGRGRAAGHEGHAAGYADG